MDVFVVLEALNKSGMPSTGLRTLLFGPVIDLRNPVSLRPLEDISLPISVVQK